MRIADVLDRLKRMGETNHLGNHPFGHPHLSARGELAKWGELKIVDLAGQAFMYIWLVRVRSVSWVRKREEHVLSSWLMLRTLHASHCWSYLSLCEDFH